MGYLKNAWYVAGWAHEVEAGKLTARTYLDQPVVLFRSGGRIRALADACPHRFAPLSRGRLDGEVIECGYHGLRFDGSGACVLNPQDPEKTPPRARVRSYPVVERQSLVWIWMGAADEADEALVPDYPEFDQPDRWRAVSGYTRIEGNYLLAIDNLMDLSHPEFLHDGSLGSPALRTAHFETEAGSPRLIRSNRWFEEGPLPPALEAYFPTNGRPVEHWANMRWEAPSNLWLDVGATFTGRARDEGLVSFAAHLLTPETAASTHYFWASLRRDALDSKEVDRQVHEALRRVFEEEDCPMIRAIQQRTQGVDLFSLGPIYLPGDAAAVRVRRALEALVADEHAAAEAEVSSADRQ